MPRGKKTTKTKIIACSQRNKQMNDVPYLPEEIIINILRRLPADHLHNDARYVCKTWANILHDHTFTKSPLLHSNSALLIHDKSSGFIRFLETKKWNLKVRNLDLLFPGEILGSSGGILLIYKSGKYARGDCGSLYTANPITMQVVKLPYPSITHKFDYQYGTIAYIPHTGEVKVVCPGTKSCNSTDWNPYILTVGKDLSWRKFSNNLPQGYMKYWRFNRSISAGGVVYWTISSSRTDHNILAINLCDETTHDLQVPKESSDGPSWLLEMGNNLCCIIWKLRGVLEVCMLKDLHRKEWAIVNRIISEKYFLECGIVDPIAWLDNNQILIFITSGRVCSYNLKTEQWKIITITHPYYFGLRLITVHTNSLVSL